MSRAQWLAEGFARHLVRWARACDPERTDADLLAAAARLASLATAEGHVCADLGDWPEADRRRLLASGLVGAPAAPQRLPLLLDDAGRLYLRRYFDYERELATALQGMAASIPRPPSVVAAERLRDLFEGGAAATPDWQQLAAAMALLGRLTVVSGGPGTGKTTTVLKLLACLLADDPDCRIALAAPTGKAAARMVEALRGQAERLGRAGQLPPETAARLPHQAATLHRLLGVLPDGGFRHHAGNPLPVDVLVVDEASMLDLALAARLVAAVPPAARLILLGDKDQLAAVEAGAVFSEIAGDPGLSVARRAALAALTCCPAAAIEPPAPLRPTPLADAVIWFARNYRFHEAPGIGELARRVNGGQVEAALQLLGANASPDLVWVADAGGGLSRALQAQLIEGYDEYLAALPDGLPGPEQLAAVFAAFNRFRVLCAIRDTARGVQAINRLLVEALRRRLGLPPALGQDDVWFAGRPVLVLRNDYTSRLFNGDIGIVLPGPAPDELLVYFPEGESGFRPVPRLRLSEHDTAFAMTVHKSQGSEFERVALILPEVPGRVVTRELIYTGITRARRQVLVAGSAAVLAAGIRTPTQRRSGLLARLDEARAEGG